MSKQSPFNEIEWLLGEWQGYGLLGKRLNLIRKRFAYELDGVVLVERTVAMLPPEKPTKDYEVHQDMLIFHADGEALKAKGFYVEGYVSSADVAVSEGGKRIVVATTQIENGPPGTQTRDVIVRKAANEFEATFEIGWRGDPLELSQKMRMERVG